MKISLTLGGLLLGGVAIFLGQVDATAGTGKNDGGTASLGADVIVGAIPDVSTYGAVGGIRAYAFGTTSCNIGTAQLNWYAGPNVNHPYIPMGMYRVEAGRLEQIGMSWGKHGYCALQQNLCGTCTPAGSGCPSLLGVGCSDPYTSSLNGSQGDLGTRSEVNGATGAFPGIPNAGMPSAPATIGRRLQVAQADLNTTTHPGAVFIAEGQYIHPQDALALNDNNNASWRAFTVNQSTWAISLTGATNQQKPAIESWRVYNTAVTTINIDIINDGRMIVGFYVRDNGNGTYRYEYAVQNLNSHRAGQSFSVPVPAGVTVTGIGFHDVGYHSGDPTVGTDWTSSVSGGAITWASQTYAQNVNANALKYSTLYNFWFDANTAPTQANATIGLFRPGSAGDPTSIVATVKTPGAPAAAPGDLNGDGIVDGADLAILLNNWGGTGSGDIDGNGIVDAADLAAMLNVWS
ncbi:MAG: hypothetical protein EXS10_04955 [Phycisphaerales bacterium]|nr:hypothetical protein [Phycisphaerales bacterium]